METIITLVYLAFLASCSLIAIFILYHLTQYSFEKRHGVTSSAIFITVFVALMFSNIILFFSISFADIFSNILPY